MHLMLTWLGVLVAGVVGALAWFQVRRLRVSYLRDYLLALTWTPALCLAVSLCLDGDPTTALIFALVLAPVIALKYFLLGMPLRNPPNDPTTVADDIKRERDARRALFFPPKGSDLSDR